MSVSAWNGRGSTRGKFHKCDQPDPKLLIRRPVKITLGLKSRYSHGARRKVGRSLKFHDALDESKVQFSWFFSNASFSSYQIFPLVYCGQLYEYISF